MSDEDKTVKIPESIEEIGGNIHSASQQLVEDTESTFRQEGSQHYVQDTSATPEEEESVDQARTMHETTSSVQIQDDDTQSDIVKFGEVSDSENQSLTLRERVFENTGQDKSGKEIDPVIAAFLTQNIMELKQSISKDIQTEVQSALHNELKKYREGIKSELIIYDRSMEQAAPGDDRHNQTVKEVTSFNSDRITSLRRVAKEEWISARKTELTSSSGVFTVICLDTSGSMKENEAWDQAKRFFMEYLKGLKDLNDGNNTIDKVALVVFGTETKVCRRFTSDFDSLKSEFENLRPDGPSPMFGGLVLSIAEAEISDKRYPDSIVEIWPKIILITDGKPTHVDHMDGSEEKYEGNAQQTKDLILEEAKRLRDERIELNIVYVGKADYVFLHELRECTAGIMMPSTDGEKTAQCNLVKYVMKASQTKKADSAGKIKSGADDFQQFLLKMMEKSVENLVKLTEGMSKMMTETHNRYITSDDKRYPAIGSRVRRSKDWTWGEQDGKGVGTIIGHHLKEPNERQYWVWVEWDENEDANVYRFKTQPGTKGDVNIVHDERIPPDDCPIAVGMKVISGKDFKGKSDPNQGVVIKMMAEDGPKKSLKAEVLWEDGTRDVHYFGDEGTDVEIKPRTVFDTPDEPRNLKVRSVSDTEVCLKWERPASCGGCSIKKYTVFKKSDHEDNTWSQKAEVDGSQTSATICDLLPKEKYIFSVRAENKIGFGKSAETESITLDLKHNRPQAPVGQVQFLEITKGCCTLSWQKNDDTPIEPITHYLIEWRERNGKWVSISVGLDTSYKMLGLRKSTKYEVRIKAVNDNGESDPLGIDTFKTLTLLDHDIPDAELHDTDIAELTEGIGKNWEMLGPHFNRENVEINRIKEDHPTIAMQIHHMLMAWKRDMGSEATFHKFLNIVEKFKRVDIDWDIIEKVAHRFKREASC